LLLLIPVGIGAVFPLLSWFARTYTVDADELTIDEGIVRRRRRVVPYRRVQQIDMDQKLIPQLLRVGVLTVETAGTAGGKVKLGLLDVRVARGLRSHVLERRAALQGTLRTPPGPAVPRPGDLKPGVTGPGFAAPSP
jgi:putative membrane protein